MWNPLPVRVQLLSLNCHQLINMRSTYFIKIFWIIVLITSLSSCKPGLKFYKTKLIKTDQAFSDYSKEHGMEEAFLKYLADDAVLLRKNMMPVEGLENIKSLFDRFDDSELQLTWEPMKAVVSESGDLGYTYGIYTAKVGDREQKGTYVSIWQIGENGEYELVFDTGNDGIGGSDRHN